MAICREQIEHLEQRLKKTFLSDKPWKNVSYSRRWLKKQMNRYLRRMNKKIDPDDIGCKKGRKPFCGWEW